MSTRKKTPATRAAKATTSKASKAAKTSKSATAAKSATAGKSSPKRKPTAKTAPTKAGSTKSTASKAPASGKSPRKSRAKAQPVVETPETTAAAPAAAAPVAETKPVAKVSKRSGSQRKSAAKRPTHDAPPPPMDPLDVEAPTEAQLRKVKSGLTAKDMRFFKQMLLERRAEILGDVQSLSVDVVNRGGNLSNLPLHMADVGTDNYEQEFTLGLMEYERRMIHEIDDALIRMEKGYYGVCVETGQPIPRVRLEAKPWAKYTIEVAREKERRMAR